MIQVYTDASFNENLNTNIVGGVGITIVFYDESGKVLREEFYAKRYTKHDLINSMDWKVERLCCKNSVLEFFAVIEAFEIFSPYEEEIELFCDWNEIERLFSNKKISNSYMLRREPNLKYLFEKFKNTYYNDNLIHIKHVKGHNNLHYNCIADFLANYWLDVRTAVNTVLSNEKGDDLHHAKMNIYFAERRKRKQRNLVINNH